MGSPWHDPFWVALTLTSITGSACIIWRSLRRKRHAGKPRLTTLHIADAPTRERASRER